MRFGGQSGTSTGEQTCEFFSLQGVEDPEDVSYGIQCVTDASRALKHVQLVIEIEASCCQNALEILAASALLCLLVIGKVLQGCAPLHCNREDAQCWEDLSAQ